MTNCRRFLFWFVIRLYSNISIIDVKRHVHNLYLSLCLGEGAHQEHVQLVDVDAPEIAHVDGRGSTLNVKNTQFEVGSWLVSDFDGRCFVGQVETMDQGVPHTTLEKAAEIPSPSEWGWIMSDTGWDVCWTTLPEATKACRQLLSCGCKKGCRGQCKCRKAALQCTALCHCGGQYAPD